jgi:hypothetical protein
VISNSVTSYLRFKGNARDAGLQPKIEWPAMGVIAEWLEVA